MRPHVQHQVVFVLRLLVADGTLKLRRDTAFKPDMSAEAVRASVRVPTLWTAKAKSQGGPRGAQRRAEQSSVDL